MTAHRFLEPLDLIFPRGNKLFGAAGSYGAALMPPWPSVAAGALRSRMLVDAGIDLEAFAAGEAQVEGLGTPQSPGPFRVSRFLLARRVDGAVEVLHPVPADVVVTENAGHHQARYLRPTILDEAIATSAPLRCLPVLAIDKQAKPSSGLWLNAAGWEAWLNGRPIAPEHLVESQALWRFDDRVGVALAQDTRSAEEGKLFTVQGVAMGDNVGFLVEVVGAEPPATGLVRLGGDGRGAALSPVGALQWPRPDYAAIARARRCRLVFTGPALFPDGWRFPGQDGEGRFQAQGICGRVVSAAVPRHGVASGWDLAHQRPKPAERTVPTGAVYWIEDLEASPEALERIAHEGLWPEKGPDPQRRAEGFNACEFAAWEG